MPKRNAKPGRKAARIANQQRTKAKRKAEIEAQKSQARKAVEATAGTVSWMSSIYTPLQLVQVTDHLRKLVNGLGVAPSFIDWAALGTAELINFLTGMYKFVCCSEGWLEKLTAGLRTVSSGAGAAGCTLAGYGVKPGPDGQKEAAPIWFAISFATKLLADAVDACTIMDRIKEEAASLGLKGDEATLFTRAAVIALATDTLAAGILTASVITGLMMEIGLGADGLPLGAGLAVLATLSTLVQGRVSSDALARGFFAGNSAPEAAASPTATDPLLEGDGLASGSGSKHDTKSEPDDVVVQVGGPR